MAKQSKVSPLEFKGPFLGLNTTHDDRQLSAGYAVKAENVLLHDGRVQPRPPMQRYWYPTSAFGHTPIPSDESVLAIFPFNRGDGIQLLYLVTRKNDGIVRVLWSVNNSGFQQLLSFQPSQGRLVPQFHVFNEHLFIYIGGRRYAIESEGTIVWQSLLPPRVTTPNNEAAVNPHVRITTSSQPQLSFRAQYAITLYSDRFGLIRESNPFYTEFFDLSVDRTFFHIFHEDYTPTILDGSIHVRVYRKNLDLGYPFWRLIFETDSFDNTDDHFFDGFLEDNIVLSSLEKGPWAPSRNTFPPAGAGSTSAPFQGRMFYANTDNGAGRLYYSEIGRPGAVDVNSFENIPDSNGAGVRGMLEMAGQLVIGTEREIHIFAGELRATTNNIAATGATPPVSGHQIYRTRSHVGPTALHSMVLAGSPQAIYFANETGFYRFNGSTSAMVTDLIKPTWSDFQARWHLVDQTMEFTIANDPRRQILYMAVHYSIDAQGDVTPGVMPGKDLHVLCYHYGIDRGDGIGGWTSLRVVEEMLDDEVVMCVGGWGILNKVLGLPRYSGLVVGGSKGTVLYMAGEEAILNIPSVQNNGSFPPPTTPVTDVRMDPFEYRSGRMTVAEGMPMAAYQLDHYVATVSAADVDGAPVVGLLGYAPDGDDDDLIDVTLLDDVVIKQRVAETMQDIQLIWKKDPAWVRGWHPRMGLTGFSLAGEISGQR